MHKKLLIATSLSVLVGLVLSLPLMAQDGTVSQIPTVKELTPALLSSLASIALSLIFRYIPKAETWFNTIDAESKQLFMLVITVVIALTIGGINMAHTGFSESSLIALGLTVFMSMTMNQTAYSFTKRSTDNRG